MEDKELKKRLKKIPDVDKNGDPIYKIDFGKNESSKEKDKSPKKDNRSQELHITSVFACPEVGWAVLIHHQ